MINYHVRVACITNKLIQIYPFDETHNTNQQFNFQLCRGAWKMNLDKVLVYTIQTCTAKVFENEIFVCCHCKCTSVHYTRLTTFLLHRIEKLVRTSICKYTLYEYYLPVSMYALNGIRDEIQLNYRWCEMKRWNATFWKV